MTMEPLSNGDLVISSYREGGRVRLIWQGRSVARDPAASIVPFCDRACVVAKGDGVALELAFEELEQMNSSTISAVIEAVERVRAAGVPVVLTYRQAVRWQRISFGALAILADGEAVVVRAV